MLCTAVSQYCSGLQFGAGYKLKSKMNVVAIIRNMHANKDGKGYQAGLEFNDISKNDLLMLNYFISSIVQV